MMMSSLFPCSSSVNCTDLYSSSSISVLPDIVGIGILTSFLTTSIVTFVIVIVAYFKDTLPGHLLTWADWGFLQTWHFCKSCRIRFGASTEKDIIPTCKHGNSKIDAQRRKSLNAFLLTLSDQQLVTGPAMMIAALAQHCQISCYEFQVVTSLGFLASTTHLITLVVLRPYLRENKVVRNIRSTAMILNLGLLLYCVMLSAASYNVDSSVHIQCVMSNFSNLQPNALNYPNALITVMFLVVQYYQSLAQLYDQHHPPLYNWLRCYCKVGRPVETSTETPMDTSNQAAAAAKKPQVKGSIDEEVFERWYEIEVIQSSYRPGSSARRESLWKRATPSGPHSVQRKLYNLTRWNWHTIFHYFCSKTYMIFAVFSDYQDAFLSELPALIMDMTFGVLQVVISRQQAPLISNNENLVDFGQIVPLFMLFLPGLAAVEMFYEAHPDRAEKDQGSLTHIIPGLQKILAKLLPASKESPETKNSSSTSANDSAIELRNRSSSSSSTDFVKTKEPVPQWQSIVDNHGGQSVITGMMTLKDCNQAITIDAAILLPYARGDVKICLNAIFWASCAFSICTGVYLWFSARYALAYGIIMATSLIFQVTQYIYFVLRVYRKARKLTKAAAEHKTLLIDPPSGTKAPPPSPSIQRAVRHGRDTDPQDYMMSGARSDSPESIPEPILDEATNRIIDALRLPRRRQTFEAFDEELVPIARRPRRLDTEANIGAQRPAGRGFDPLRQSTY